MREDSLCRVSLPLWAGFSGREGFILSEKGHLSAQRGLLSSTSRQEVHRSLVSACTVVCTRECVPGMYTGRYTYPAYTGRHIPGWYTYPAYTGRHIARGTPTNTPREAYSPGRPLRTLRLVSESQRGLSGPKISPGEPERPLRTLKTVLESQRGLSGP